MNNYYHSLQVKQELEKTKPTTYICRDCECYIPELQGCKHNGRINPETSAGNCRFFRLGE